MLNLAIYLSYRRPASTRQPAGTSPRIAARPSPGLSLAAAIESHARYGIDPDDKLPIRSSVSYSYAQLLSYRLSGIRDQDEAAASRRGRGGEWQVS
jgi:hypothetical protein